MGRKRGFDWVEARRLYGLGYSLRQVARALGVTAFSVRYALVSLGVVLRGRGGNQGGHSRHRG